MDFDHFWPISHLKHSESRAYLHGTTSGSWSNLDHFGWPWIWVIQGLFTGIWAWIAIYSSMRMLGCYFGQSWSKFPFLLTWKMPYHGPFWLSRQKHITRSDCFHLQPQSLSGFAVYLRGKAIGFENIRRISSWGFLLNTHCYRNSPLGPWPMGRVRDMVF